MEEMAPSISGPSDDEFLAAFEACRWPLEQWHHREHIKVAYLYLRRYPFDTAMGRIREKIKAHNAAHGVTEGPASGYHETMTQAWLRLVQHTLSEYGPAENADSFYEQHPELWQKKVLRLFYSRALFMSPRAKGEFMEPDLAPLPRSSIQTAFCSFCRQPKSKVEKLVVGEGTVAICNRCIALCLDVLRLEGVDMDSWRKIKPETE